MTAIEDRLQGLTTAILPFDLPSAPEIVERGRRRRRRRRSRGAVALVATLVTGVGVATRLLDDDTPTVTTFEGRGGDPAGHPHGDPADDPTAPTATANAFPIPDVVGLEVATARATLERLGLWVTVAGTGTGDETARVVGQDPEGGTTVHRGDQVRVVAGSGPGLFGVVRSISGELLDGGTWTVVNDPTHGLCVLLTDENLGCDDVGPVIAPDADPASPRIALPRNAEDLYSGVLFYGFLPPGATRVDLVHADGGITSGPLTVDDVERFWAIPVDPADNPVRVVYRDDAGAEIAEFTV